MRTFRARKARAVPDYATADTPVTGQTAIMLLRERFSFCPLAKERCMKAHVFGFEVHRVCQIAGVRQETHRQPDFKRVLCSVKKFQRLQDKGARGFEHEQAHQE